MAVSMANSPSTSPPIVCNNGRASEISEFFDINIFRGRSAGAGIWAVGGGPRAGVMDLEIRGSDCG